MHLWIIAVVGACAWGLALEGCGSSSKGGFGPGGSSSSSGGAGEGGSGGDDASGSSSGSASGSSSGGSSPYTGTFTASKTQLATPLYGLTAGFYATPATGTPSCAGTMSGSCCYIAPGSPSDAGTDAGTGGGFVSAGALSIKDGPSLIAVLMPNTINGYSIASTGNPSVKWNPGDMLSLSAAGSTVQAFTASFAAVDDLVVTTPTLSATTPTTVPITSDLAVSWTAGTAKTVVLTVLAFKGTAGDGLISCSVGDSAGTVTVPSAMLGHLTSGDSGSLLLTRTAVVMQGTAANVTLNLASETTTGGAAKFM